MPTVAKESRTDNSIPVLATATILDDDVTSPVVEDSPTPVVVAEQQQNDSDSSPEVTVTVIPISSEADADGKCLGIWLFALLLIGLWLNIPQLQSTYFDTRSFVSFLITIASTIISSTLACSGCCCCCQYKLSSKRRKLAIAILVSLCIELLIQLLLTFSPARAYPLDDEETSRIRAAIGMGVASHVVAMVFCAVFIWGDIRCCRICMK